MEIIEVTPNEYEDIVNAPYHIFGSSTFNIANKERAEAIYYLLFKEGKYRLGIIGGVREGVFYSPFSAPFGGYSYLNEDIRISYIDEALSLLSGWAKEKQIAAIRITLPPGIYGESFISKQVNSLYRNGFSIEKVDLNYAYHLHHFDEHYASSIWYNAKKNLKIALGNQLSFSLCDAGEKEKAYNIITQNREARGFPLRMTWQQVQLSASVMNADFFLVNSNEGIAVAAAVIFHVAKKMVQVIYWGDLPEYAGLKTMNFLSYKVFEHYKTQQFEIIDIGPSTENSVPNFGLCEFKESIGCDISCKFSFSKSIA
jgi:hypothetical protein